MGSVRGAVWLPVSRSELTRLERMLWESKVVVPGNYKDEHCRLADYVAKGGAGGVEFRALFDRNLISPIAALAAGQRVSENREQARLTRLACGALCFCIWGGVLVEPAMALYEYAALCGNDAAQRELAFFRKGPAIPS